LQPLRGLQTLDLSGNRISKINGLKKLRQVHLWLGLIGLDRNNFTCDYLIQMKRELKEIFVDILKPRSSSTNPNSFMGIECRNSPSETEIILTDENGIIVKIDELIGKVGDMNDRIDAMKANEVQLITMIVKLQHQVSNSNFTIRDDDARNH
jgi:hypothetical protein